MEGFARRDLLSRGQYALSTWKLRPNTGRWWKDVIFLFCIAFVQTTVLPSLFGRFGYLDLITPWLVITFIRQRPLPALTLASIAAMLLETRLAVPAGLYLCAYWILSSLLILIRPALSWRYRTPWFVCYIVSTVWVLLFENFVLNFLQADVNFHADYIVQVLLRLIVATGFGMYLSSEWMNIDAEEPVPQ